MVGGVDLMRDFRCAFGNGAYDEMEWYGIGWWEEGKIR
jgi:hypothetical protein